MGEGSVVWLAVFGGVVAAACAIACAVATAWIARVARQAPVPTQRVLPAPVRTVHAAPPPPTYFYPGPWHQSNDTNAPAMVLGDAPVPASGRAPVVLEGNYPQLGGALGAWMQVEPDPVERIRIARDLGTVGGAGAARALLDGVRTGVLSPTIAADNLERGGFDAGIAVAAALHDPEPRVRALASSLVGRSTPLRRTDLVPHVMAPMPEPPPPPPLR